MTAYTFRFLVLWGAFLGLAATAAAQNPIAYDDWAMTSSIQPTSVNVLSNDQPGWYGVPLDPGSVEIVTMPVSGTATVNPDTGVITYEPVPGLWGVAEIEYAAADLNGEPTNIATVYVWVDHAPPIAQDDFAMTYYDQSVQIALLSNDSGGTAAIDPDSVSITSQPSHGTISLGAGGVVTYTPGGVDPVTDSFEYTIADEYGVESEPAIVWVWVMNTPPQITQFTNWQTSAGYWYFEGYVSDENPQSCTVEFGGVLAGQPAVTPAANGRFSFVVQFASINTSVASAIATDDAGQQSEKAETAVFSY